MVGQALTNVLKNAAEAEAARRAAEPGVDGRLFARLVVDDDQINSLIGQPGVEEQITLVVDRYLDRLAESVTTG